MITSKIMSKSQSKHRRDSVDGLLIQSAYFPFKLSMYANSEAS